MRKKTCPFSKYFRILYIFARTCFAILPFFNVFLPFLWKIVHMPLLSRICPDRHGELGKKCDTNFILTFSYAKVKIRWYFNGIKDATMLTFLQLRFHSIIQKISKDSNIGQKGQQNVIVNAIYSAVWEYTLFSALSSCTMIEASK